MRERLRHQFNQCSQLHKLLVLFTLLTLPYSVWGQDSYGISVAGTAVTSANASAITGAGITGTVTYDANTQTLTLNGANIEISTNYAIFAAIDATLNVKLIGENVISCGNHRAFSTTNGLKFQTNADTSPGQLTITSTYDISTTNFYDIPGGANVTYENSLVATKTGTNTLIISVPVNYGITVAGTAITSTNASDVLDGTVNDGKVSYDAEHNILTLNGAAITGSIFYTGTANLTIALNGTNSVTNTDGTYAIGVATYTPGLVKFAKATGASSAELTITCGNGYTPISATNPTLGSGLYWKPIEEYSMVITEDPNFLILNGVAIADGRTINGSNGSLSYNASNKILTLNGYTNDFGPQHAIKTGVSGLKVKLIGASTINCSADSAVFHAFCNSASIQFIKDDASSRLTMTGTAFNNFEGSNITYDGLFYYAGTDNKYITQPAAPELGWSIHNDINDNSYTFATIEYASTERTGNNTPLYAAANPVLMYSFDYADPQKQDVSNQTYPTGGIKMTDPGILTAWIEVGAAKSSESKGVRFGLIENPIAMEFDGTPREISITPAPSLTSGVTADVNSNYTGAFSGFASLDATNNKLTINSCYSGKIGFTFTNTDICYTSLNDSTHITFKILPPKPVLSVVGGTYDEAQTVTITSSYQGTGVSIKYCYGTASTNAETYTGPLNITENKTLTAWVEINGVKSEEVTAAYVIRIEPNLNYSVATASAKISDTGVSFTTPDTAPTLTNTLGIDITYTSSNTDVANINNTGDITIVGAGTTIISAKASDETQYKPTSASYELTVKRERINPFYGAMNGQNFATHYSEVENLALPEGLKAYVVTGVSDNVVTTTPINYIPYHIPILLEKTGNLSEKIIFDGYSGEVTNFSNNRLRYTDADYSVTDDTFILYMNEFVKATDKISAHHCYLDLNGVNHSRGMYNIGDGTTAIKRIEQETTTNEQWYDLLGRRIEQPTKSGIYIKNGKKVVINNK